MARFCEIPKQPETVTATQFFKDQEPWPKGVQIKAADYAHRRNRFYLREGLFGGHIDYDVVDGVWIVEHDDGEMEVVSDAQFQDRFEPEPDKDSLDECVNVMEVFVVATYYAADDEIDSIWLDKDLAQKALEATGWDAMRLFTWNISTASKDRNRDG